MRVRSTTLPDGRYLVYYDFAGNDWTTVTGAHPDLSHIPRLGPDRSSELRWNPLIGEWVITATHRQDRTFLPPSTECPFCPSSASREGEISEAAYDLAVLQNRFPSLQPNPGQPTLAGDDLFPVEPSRGLCEVVLYSPVHTLTLANASVE